MIAIKRISGSRVHRGQGGRRGFARLACAGVATLFCAMLPLRAQETLLRPSLDATITPGDGGQSENPYAPRGGLDRAGPPPARPRVVPPAPPASAAPSPQRPAGPRDIEGRHAPAGIGLGGFDLFPSLELRGGFQEVSGDEGAYGAAIAALEAEGAIGAVDVALDGEVEAERGQDAFSGLRLDSRLDVGTDVNRHIGLRGSLTAARTPESGLVFNNANSLTSLPDEMVLGAELALPLRANRATLAPRAGYQQHDFSGDAGADDLDYHREFAGLRASYTFSPLLRVQADAELARNRFDTTEGADGIRRGSQSRRLLAGAVYTPGDWLEMDVAAGFAEAEFEDGSSLSGPVARAALTWRPSALTDLTLEGEHAIAEAVSAGGGERETSLAFSALHRLRSYLEARARLAWLREVPEDGEAAARIDAEGELAYAVRRGIYLTGGGSWSRRTEGAGAGEEDWQVYMGLKLAR